MKVINLLPKERQKEIYLEDRFRLVVLFFGISVSTLLLTSLCLVGARMYLKNESSNISNEITQLKTAVNKQENAELKTNISKINNLILDFRTLSEATPAWSKVLLAFGRLVPEGVGVTNFSADLEKKRIDISGFSKSRESVIELYNNVKADTKNFKDINYPLENVAKPTDVAFKFTFFIQPETLK